MHPWDNMSPQTTALFHSLGHVMHAWHSLMPSNDLSRAQFHTLATLGRLSHCHSSTGCTTVSAIAADLQVSLPAVSQNIRTLEKLGYVERAAHENDRRVSYVQMTHKGNALMHKSMQDLLQKLEKAISSVPDMDVNATVKALENIATVLELTAKENQPC